MSTQAMSISGIAPKPNPVPDRGASAFYGDHSRSAITQSRAPTRSHSNPLIVVRFAHGRAGWRGGN